MVIIRDTLDVVKQSAALCLLKLFKTDPSIIPSGEMLVSSLTSFIQNVIIDITIIFSLWDPKIWVWMFFNLRDTWWSMKRQIQHFMLPVGARYSSSRLMRFQRLVFCWNQIHTKPLHMSIVHMYCTVHVTHSHYKYCTCPTFTLYFTHLRVFTSETDENQIGGCLRILCCWFHHHHHHESGSRIVFLFNNQNIFLL